MSKIKVLIQWVIDFVMRESEDYGGVINKGILIVGLCTSVCGSEVECIVAIDATRVRFPADA